MEEEGRIQSRTNGAKEENLVVTAKTREFNKPFTQKKERKEGEPDAPNIECFNCHKMGLQTTKEKVQKKIPRFYNRRRRMLSLPKKLNKEGNTT